MPNTIKQLTPFPRDHVSGSGDLFDSITDVRGGNDDGTPGAAAGPSSGQRVLYAPGNATATGGLTDGSVGFSGTVGFNVATDKIDLTAASMEIKLAGPIALIGSDFLHH